MRRAGRSVSALCAMAGLLASPVLASILSLHVAFEHDHGDEDAEHVVMFQGVLHGHAHDEGTPEHDHVVTGPSVLKPAPRALEPTAPLVALAADMFTLAGGRLVGGVGIGRQARASPPPELQPVLRI